MTDSTTEKGGADFDGVKLLLCENLAEQYTETRLRPDKAIVAIGPLNTYGTTLVQSS
jgi:hypothetical protein